MDYNKKAKYRLVASETLDDLIERINYLAESGYELDKLTTSGTPNNDWQGMAVMKLANEQTHTDHSDSTEQKALHIADVRLSCFKEVFEKFKEIQEESDFYQWLYRKSHEA